MRGGNHKGLEMSVDVAPRFAFSCFNLSHLSPTLRFETKTTGDRLVIGVMGWRRGEGMDGYGWTRKGLGRRAVRVPWLVMAGCAAAETVKADVAKGTVPVTFAPFRREELCSHCSTSTFWCLSHVRRCVCCLTPHKMDGCGDGADAPGASLAGRIRGGTKSDGGSGNKVAC